MDASSSNDTSPSFCPHTWEPDFKLTLTFYLLPSPTPSPQSSPNICTDVTEAIGNTPMIKLNSRMCPPGRSGGGYYFADLVAAVSDLFLELRVRFTSPHPTDFPPKLLAFVIERPNVCKSLNLPAQSGSTTSTPASAATRRKSTGTHCRS